MNDTMERTDTETLRRAYTLGLETARLSASTGPEIDREFRENLTAMRRELEPLANRIIRQIEAWEQELQTYGEGEEHKHAVEACMCRLGWMLEDGLPKSLNMD